jgi:hypothetical protein
MAALIVENEWRILGIMEEIKTLPAGGPEPMEESP